MDNTELPTLSQQGTPQINFDQMNHIKTHLHDLNMLQDNTQKGFIPQ